MCMMLFLLSASTGLAFWRLVASTETETLEKMECCRSFCMYSLMHPRKTPTTVPHKHI